MMPRFNVEMTSSGKTENELTISNEQSWGKKTSSATIMVSFHRVVDFLVFISNWFQHFKLDFIKHFLSLKVLLIFFLQEIFVMVRHHKTTIFLDCKEDQTVYDMKKMIEGILKKQPEDQKLFVDDQVLEDNKKLGDCGFTSQTAKAQSPATIGLAFKQEGNFLCLFGSNKS